MKVSLLTIQKNTRGLLRHSPLISSQGSDPNFSLRWTGPQLAPKPGCGFLSEHKYLLLMWDLPWPMQATKHILKAVQKWMTVNVLMAGGMQHINLKLNVFWERSLSGLFHSFNLCYFIFINFIEVESIDNIMLVSGSWCSDPIFTCLILVIICHLANYDIIIDCILLTISNPHLHAQQNCYDHLWGYDYMKLSHIHPDIDTHKWHMIHTKILSKLSIPVRPLNHHAFIFSILLAWAFVSSLSRLVDFVSGREGLWMAAGLEKWVLSLHFLNHRPG